MSPWLLAIPVFVAVSFLFLHLISARGLRRALIFTIFCLIVMIDKEASQGRFHPPDYILHGEFPRIFGASIVVVLGWYFAFVCSWYLSERILTAMRLKHPPKPAMLIILIALLVAMFSLAMEMTGIAMGWWEWTDMRGRLSPLSEASITLAGMLPYWQRIGTRITAWAFHSLVVFVPYLLLEETRLRDRLPNWSKPLLSLAYIAAMYIITNLTGHADMIIIGVILLIVAITTNKFDLTPPSTFFDARSLSERVPKAE